jgi:hypothetical protein
MCADGFRDMSIFKLQVEACGRVDEPEGGAGLEVEMADGDHEYAGL